MHNDLMTGIVVPSGSLLILTVLASFLLCSFCLLPICAYESNFVMIPEMSLQMLKSNINNHSTAT
jgi:hypothetical protein